MSERLYFVFLLLAFTFSSFFRGRSFCLDDGPTGDGPDLAPSFRNKLPGQILDGNKQCEAQYGAGWRRDHTVSFIYHFIPNDSLNTSEKIETEKRRQTDKQRNKE